MDIAATLQAIRVLELRAVYLFRAPECAVFPDLAGGDPLAALWLRHAASHLREQVNEYLRGRVN